MPRPIRPPDPKVEFHQADCLEWMKEQPDGKFDLVFGSPPYVDARTYGINAQMKCQDWIFWMLDVSVEAARVCRGPVIWVVASVTRGRNYQPGPEGLMYLWWKRKGECHLYRPCIYHRIGIPGSGGKDWFRADWEYVICLKKPGPLPWSDNLACGKACRYRPGGDMSYRLVDGIRINSRRTRITNHSKNGRQSQFYIEPKVANPGNVVGEVYGAREVSEMLSSYENGDVLKMIVGGGHMGHKLAHREEENCVGKWGGRIGW